MLYVFFPQEVDGRSFLLLCPSSGSPSCAPRVNSAEESGREAADVGRLPRLQCWPVLYYQVIHYWYFFFLIME